MCSAGLWRLTPWESGPGIPVSFVGAACGRALRDVPSPERRAPSPGRECRALLTPSQLHASAPGVAAESVVFVATFSKSSSVRSSLSGVIDTRSCSRAHQSVPSSAGSSGLTVNQKCSRPIGSFPGTTQPSVLANRDARPRDAGRLLRKIHVDEAEGSVRKEQLQRALHERLERVELRLGVYDRCAEGDAAASEQHTLSRGRHRPGVPNAVPDVRPEIDPGEDDVGAFPEVSSKCHAVRRRAVDPISLEVPKRRSTIRERPVGCNRRAHRRLLDVRSDDPDVTELRGDLRKRENPRTVNPVVVRDQEVHASILVPVQAPDVRPRSCVRRVGWLRRRHCYHFDPFVAITQLQTEIKWTSGWKPRTWHAP